MSLIQHRFIRKIVKFYIVWATALIGNSLIIYILSDYFHIDIAFSIGAVYIYNITIIFLLQKHFTFQNKSQEYKRKQFLKFSILMWIVMLIFYTTIPWLTKLTSSYLLSNLIVSLAITVINFITQNSLIFNKRA